MHRNKPITNTSKIMLVANIIFLFICFFCIVSAGWVSHSCFSIVVAGFISNLFFMSYLATATAILSTKPESESCRFSEVFDIFQYFCLSNSAK